MNSCANAIMVLFFTFNVTHFNFVEDFFIIKFYYIFTPELHPISRTQVGSFSCSRREMNDSGRN